MAKVKNIIFDWSGVINENALAVYKTVREMFDLLGGPKISVSEMRENWEQPYMKFYNKYLPDLTLEEEKIAYKKIMCEQTEYRCFPGIADLIRKLHNNGFDLFVLSSDNPATLDKELTEFGLDGVFTKIYYDIHDKIAELKIVLEENNLTNKETIFIGDTSHEIEAGKKAGTLTAAVTWGLYPENRLIEAKPDFIFHSITEMRDAITLISEKRL